MVLLRTYDFEINAQKFKHSETEVKNTLKKNHNEQNKTGFRQWKSGKQWLFAGAALLTLGVATTGVVELPGIGIIQAYADAPTPKGTPTGDANYGLWGLITTGTGVSEQPGSRNIGIGEDGYVYTGQDSTLSTDIWSVGSSTYVTWWVWKDDDKGWQIATKESVRNYKQKIDTSKEGTIYYQANIRYWRPITGYVGPNMWTQVSQINVTKPVDATKVTVKGTDYLINQKGASTKLTAIVDPENYTGDLTWSIDSTNFATIDPRTGLITAKEGAVGTATITASVKNKDGKIVKGSKEIKIGGGVENQSVFEDQTATFTIEGLEGASGLEVEWIKVDKNKKETSLGKSNSASYTTDKTKKDTDDGTQYYAKVTSTYIDVDPDGKSTTRTSSFTTGKGTLTVKIPYALDVECVVVQDGKNIVLKTENISQNNVAGAEYETTHPEIDGYTYVGLQNGSAPEKGTFDSNKKVIYVYTKEVDPLHDDKINAKTEIDNLVNLTDKEKEDFKKQVDDSKTKEEINQVVEDAKKQDAKNLQDAKDAAKEQISKENLPNLTDEERIAFEKQIDDAKTKKEVQDVVDAAKLQDDKNAAKDIIDKLPNTSKEDKDKAKDAIDGATDKGAIKKIVKEAQKLNDSRKNKGGSGNNGGSNSNKSGNTKKNLPSTGEVAGSAGLVGIALASIAGFLGLARKKREDEE